MAVLAMALEKEIAGVDNDKIVKMALVHDIGESIVGDITPCDGVLPDTKFKLEDEVLLVSSYSASKPMNPLRRCTRLHPISPRALERGGLACGTNTKRRRLRRRSL